MQGIGDAAVAVDESQRLRTVSFLKGRTLGAGPARCSQGAGTSRPADVRAVVGAVARSVPSDPPETDDQTRGACAEVDQEAVARCSAPPRRCRAR